MCCRLATTTFKSIKVRNPIISETYFTVKKFVNRTTSHPRALLILASVLLLGLAQGCGSGSGSATATSQDELSSFLEENPEYKGGTEMTP